MITSGCFDECLECKGFYHQLCHIEEDEKTIDHTNVPVQENVLQNLCPACKRQRSSLFNKGKVLNIALIHKQFIWDCLLKLNLFF